MLKNRSVVSWLQRTLAVGISLLCPFLLYAAAQLLGVSSGMTHELAGTMALVLLAGYLLLPAYAKETCTTGLIFREPISDGLWMGVVTVSSLFVVSSVLWVVLSMALLVFGQTVNVLELWGLSAISGAVVGLCCAAYFPYHNWRLSRPYRSNKRLDSGQVARG